MTWNILSLQLEKQPIWDLKKIFGMVLHYYSIL